MKNKKVFVIVSIIFVVMNSTYLGFELYKNILRNQWKSDETREVFMTLMKLNQWTEIIEIFIFLTLLIMIGCIFKKNSDLLTPFIYMLFVGCSVFWLLGILFSNLFNAPIGNLVQQLSVSICFLIVLIMYKYLKILLKRPRLF